MCAARAIWRQRGVPFGELRRRCSQVSIKSVGRQETAIHPHDTLVALAEVAAAFAGFSGVVAAFGHRSPSDWSAVARFRFENLLTVAVASSILAFLPVVLAHFSIAPVRVWAWSGAALALFCLWFLLQLFRRRPKATAEGGGLRGLSTPGDDRQVALTACRSFTLYHGWVIRGLTSDTASWAFLNSVAFWRRDTVAWC